MIHFEFQEELLASLTESLIKEVEGLDFRPKIFHLLCKISWKISLNYCEP